MPYSMQGVRHALKSPVALGPDLFLLALVGSVIGGVVMIGAQMASPYHEVTEIDLSLGSLPYYTLLSLCRGFAAYALSLLFTLAYGAYAAHHPRAERLMMPALDVLQAIPVLGFLPGLVLALIALFPTREIGLELACIVMIFTGQAWNMTFSFHASLRNLPPSLREVAAVQRLNGWQVFRLLEVPAATIGLVWNSMISMAGGWFFLTVTEAFTLGSRDFRVPGIGSYMNEAIHQGDSTAMTGAVMAMIVMIVLVDQLFWRPLVAWSQRFKIEDSAETEPPRSWVLDLLRRSRLHGMFLGSAGARSGSVVTMPFSSRVESNFRWRAALLSGWQRVRPIVRGLFFVGLLLSAAWGLWSLFRLLSDLPLFDPNAREDWLTVLLALTATFVRTTAAVALGMAWALPIGILIGLSARWSQRLQPVIQILASFPAPMLFPLVTLFLTALGVPFAIGCVFLLLLGAQWYILFNVIAGARAIPDDLKEVAQAYGLTRSQRWTRLYLPCVFPQLLTGLITAAGGAWNATIVSEYVLVQGETFVAFGLGSIISLSTARGHYPLLCASVVTMALSVVLMNRFFWKRLYRLAEARFSLSV